MIFWVLMFLTFTLISIATLNPIPFLLILAAWIIAIPFERPLYADIRAAGRNPDLPPPPTSFVGCQGCVLWFVVLGLALLLLAGTVGAVLEGSITP